MATLNKMTGFKVFKGTKETFISSGKATTYADAVVFITGGEGNAKNSCIFAQGTYFANIQQMMEAVNFVKGINVGGVSYNAAANGGYVAFEASDPSTVAVNANSNGIAIGLTDAFVTKVNTTASNLGTATDAANESGSAFARIANLAALVADLTGGETTSIAGQITAAINALRTEITGDLTDATDAKTMEAINDELNGLQAVLAGLKVNGKNLVNNGVAQEVVLTGGDIKVGGNSAVKDATVESVVANHEGRVKANEDAIAVLKGNDTVDGSVDKKIKDAINAFAGSADGDNTIENVTELLNYVNGVDGSKNLASAIANIAENTGKIATLNGDDKTAGSVDKKVKDAMDSEVARANAAYATAAQGAKADTAYQKPTDGIGSADLSAAVNASLAKAEAAAPQATTYTKTEVDNKFAGYYTKAEVDAMWMWEEL